MTYGCGVERFTLDPSIGEFILTAEDMKLPEVQKTVRGELHVSERELHVSEGVRCIVHV